MMRKKRVKNLISYILQPNEKFFHILEKFATTHLDYLHRYNIRDSNFNLHAIAFDALHRAVWENAGLVDKYLDAPIFEKANDLKYKRQCTQCDGNALRLYFYAVEKGFLFDVCSFYKVVEKAREEGVENTLSFLEEWDYALDDQDFLMELKGTCDGRDAMKKAWELYKAEGEAMGAVFD